MKNDDKPKAKPTRAAKPRPAKESARERAPRGESAADHLPPIDVDAPTEAVKTGAQPAEPLLAVPPEKRVRIGITGEPGAGKSALARQLGALGGTVIDVDRLGHELLEHPRIKRDLARAFGEDILTGDGEIDRRALAAKAFATADATATLNGIMHPPIAARAKALAAKAGNFVVLDAGLLHEIGLGEECTISIYVKANRDNRVNRVTERGWDDSELARREQALGDADARRKKCNLAVDNTGDPNLLAAYAKTILARQIGLDLSALKKQAPLPLRNVDQGNGNGNGDHDEDAQDSNDDASSEGDASEQNDRAPQPEPQPQRRDQQRPGDRRFDQRGNPQQQNRHGNQQRDGGNQQRDGGNQQGQPGNGQPGNGQPGNQGNDNRPPVKVILDDYLRRTLPDLQGEADKLDVRDVKWLKKHDLICEILRRVAAGRADEIVVEGYIELIKDQQAYIRSPLNNYLPVNTDAFIANPQIRRYGLKAGMQVAGLARAPRGNERCPQLLSINTVMDEPENKRTAVQDFEHLVPLHAHERLFMELPNDPTDYSLRIIDLVAPIGKGQRGLIVAQPKCGKTVYMTKIAKAITTNNPEVVLIVLLVDERPEEVTDMQRSVRGEVVASTFDQPASRHVQCAEMVINKAKRLVERGKDVVILLDSITRLARAYNSEAPNSGRILSGGIDSNALIKPKQFFGAARKIENGGSLTILATAIVDTGSLMDTVIFEEFKGTGNMELVLDRRLANRRVFPAVDCAQSGTRKDELLIKNDDELRRVWALRKFLAERNGADAIDFLKSKLKNSKTNIEFLLTIDPDKLSSW
jgi:transcription termination factor Rho